MMIFDLELAGNDSANMRNMTAQCNRILRARQGMLTGNAQRDTVPHIPPKYEVGLDGRPLKVNAGVRPTDLFREFDQVTLEEFRLDEGDNILNDLLPLARSLPIGRTVFEFSRSSDAGNFQQSMSGEIGTVFDNVDYDQDKTIIPVNRTGFKRSWREYEQLSLEDFDDMVNLHREDIRRHRNGLIDSFLDGHKNPDGTDISHDGTTWLGVRRDSRVDQVTITTDISDVTANADDIRNQFNALITRRQVNNKILTPAKFYISVEAGRNLQRFYNDSFEWKGNLKAQIMTLEGMAGLEVSSKLSGGQILSMPLEQKFVTPLVGRGLSTIQRARLNWDDSFAFENVSAIGWLVKTDYGSTNRGVQYASL